MTARAETRAGTIERKMYKNTTTISTRATVEIIEICACAELELS